MMADSRERAHRRTVRRVVTVAVLAQLASWTIQAWREARQYESIVSLQLQLRAAQDEVREAQLALSGRLAENGDDR